MRTCPGVQDLIRFIRKAVVILLVLEVGYLVVINGALSLPVTQELVNRIRPEKFQVSWNRAWSWYPVRVHVTGLAADGESRTQQWQLQAPNASASINLLPLLFKRVWVSDVRAEDIDYRQRPRLKPDKDYSATLPFFPAIGERDVTPVGDYPSKKRSPWHIAVDGIVATGTHHFWIFQMRGTARGELSGGLTFETRGGPFSLDLPQVDLTLEPVTLSGDYEVLSRGRLGGTLGFAPFVPRENRGVALLSFLRTDLEADLDLNDLSFLDLFLLNLEGVSVDGKGRVTGRLHFDRGKVLAPTRLAVDARELGVSALSHVIGGEGAVNLSMDDTHSGQGLVMGFHYEGLTVRPAGSDIDLLTGEGLGIEVRGDGKLLKKARGYNPSRAVELTVENLSVPDLALLQHYLPPQLPLQVHGGDGTLDSSIRLTPTSLEVDLVLDSDNADLSLRDYRFATDLDLVFSLDNPDIRTQATSVSGSYLQLSDSRVQRAGKSRSVSWDTRLEIEQGAVSLSGNPAEKTADSVVDLFEDLSEADASDRLSRVWAELQLSASMSNLAWITALIDSRHAIELAGSGTLQGNVSISGGMVQPPSELVVTSDDLSVSVLDYVSRGSGEVDFVVEEGQPRPLLSLAIELSDADLRRRSDEISHIEDVALSLEALVRPSEDDEKPVRAEELDFKIASARISDMAAFNGYLPPGGAIAFAGGSADLTADIRLRPRDAGGWLKLRATNTEALVAEQSIRGDIRLDLELVAGTPEEMAFDISGSKLQMENVQVAGERDVFDDEHWSARFTLAEGKAVWREPVRLRVKGVLEVSDTRPFVTLFENGGWRPRLVSRMLSVSDIEGEATLSLADDVLYIEDAILLSDKLELAARGSLSRESRDAMIYLRYEKLDGLLKYSGQDSNLDIVNARKTFDAFEPARRSPLAGQ